MIELRTYLQELEKAHRIGRATEHTFRPALKTLIEGMFPEAVEMLGGRGVAAGRRTIPTSQ